MSLSDLPLYNFDRQSPHSPASGSHTSVIGPFDAEKPFDASAKADVILRSSDSVDFFVLKAILCLVSPVLDNVLSSSRETNEGERANETKNGLPVFELAEDSNTIHNLLLLLYPYAKEPTNTLEVYASMAEAAEKYAMEETIHELRKLVMKCDAMVEDPMATFIVAMHFGWVEVMREAAFHTLAIPLQGLISGDEQEKYLRFMGVVDYRRLLKWHIACREALNTLFRDWTLRKTLLVFNEKGFLEDRDVPDEAGRYIRCIFGPHLQKRLKETGCAGSTILMDDCAVSNETLKSILDRYSSRHYSNARESMMKDIEEALLKIPLKINGILVQPGDGK